MTEPVPVSPRPTATPNLNKALAAFQAEMPTIERDRHVDVETKGDKPNYGYSYATLANATSVAMPLLGKHGLSFTAFPGSMSDGKMGLRYALLHESGEERTGEFPLSAEGGIQILGGRFTYARRYCLLAVTGLAPEEDDDAAAAQAEDARPAARRATTPKPRRSTPAADPQDGEPQPNEDAAPTPDAELKRMQREMFALFREIGLGAKEDRDARLVQVTNMLGREVASVNDLSTVESLGVIDALRKASKSPEPLSAAVEIYQRTSGLSDVPTEPVTSTRPAKRTALAETRTTQEQTRDAVLGTPGDESAPWEGELPV
jgi:hypothetical protein